MWECSNIFIKLDIYTGFNQTPRFTSCISYVEEKTKTNCKSITQTVCKLTSITVYSQTWTHRTLHSILWNEGLVPQYWEKQSSSSLIDVKNTLDVCQINAAICASKTHHYQFPTFLSCNRLAHLCQCTMFLFSSWMHSTFVFAKSQGWSDALHSGTASHPSPSPTTAKRQSIYSSKLVW